MRHSVKCAASLDLSPVSYLTGVWFGSVSRIPWLEESAACEPASTSGAWCGHSMARVIGESAVAAKGESEQVSCAPQSARCSRSVTQRRLYPRTHMATGPIGPEDRFCPPLPGCQRFMRINRGAPLSPTDLVGTERLCEYRQSRAGKMGGAADANKHRSTPPCGRPGLRRMYLPVEISL